MLLVPPGRLNHRAARETLGANNFASSRGVETGNELLQEQDSLYR